MRKVAVIFILGLCYNVLIAQTTKFYSTENGLSNSLINQVYQDKKGFIWIATENGLNKFDGAQFSVYRRTVGDSTSLKSNHIKILFEDSSGNFWVRCLSGLVKYDRDNDAFLEIKISDDDSIRYYPSVVSICERRNGDVWFATTNAGLYSVKKGETVYRQETQLNERLSSQIITVVYEDSHNRLWIGSENSGVNLYSFDNDEMLAFSADSPSDKRITSNAISAICEGENGEIFVGTLDGGLNRFDFPDMKISHIHDIDGNTHLPVKSLIYDKDRQLLVGTDGFGMKKYFSEKQVLEPYEPFSTPFDFAKSKVHSLIHDRDGNIWAGIYQKGIFFIPANSNGFKYYGYKSFRKNSIGSNCITAIHKDRDGIIWIGTDNDGLYAIDEKSDKVRHYEHGDRLTSVPNTILCIHDSDDGKLRLGSYLNGCAIFDKQTGKCTYINSQNNRTLLSNKVYCITGDGQGALWLGTYGGGLYKYNLATQNITEHYLNDCLAGENSDGLVNNWVNSLIYEDSGKLWIGTLDGLNCLDTKTGIFEAFKVENQRMPSNIIFAMKQDRHKNIWISTNEGLVRLAGTTKETRLYSTADGLASNEICAIEEDENGNIWLSTLAGISKYSPADDKFTNFYSSDGLQVNEFSYRVGFKSSDGEIFFGGMDGITGFFPKEIHLNERKLNVYVTNFYLFGKPVHRNQKSGGQAIFDTPALELSKISLAASDNVLSFEFSTLEYANSEGISYQYRLKNFDAGWISTPPGTGRVTYTNLNPGEYRFFYQALDKENKSEIRSIDIIIRPPWYDTLWAKITYLALAILIIYCLYEYISSRIKHRNKMLRLEHADRIKDAKLQFFTNISHEIRTPMTLIISPLEKLLKGKNPLDLQDTYLLIYRNAQRILRLVNQLMDMRKIDRGQMKLKLRETDMVGFIKDIMQSFEYMANTKHIDFEFRHSMPSLKVWVDLNNFDKVLFNVISNAFKFTPENGTITVDLTVGSEEIPGPLKNYAEIKIFDTGIGVEETQIERIFDRFYQIDNEVTNSNYGTGIGLHLSRSLVELQHGVIYAENRSDRKGSCFIIRMPLGSRHLKPEEKMEVSGQTLPEISVQQNSESEGKHTSMRILIVDDNDDLRQFVYNFLQNEFSVATACNGAKAWEFVQKELPDMVVSDIMMPEMDGFELCKTMKSTYETSHIPVILLTALSEKTQQLHGLGLGADDYLTKPFDMTLLSQRIKTILRNREIIREKALKMIKRDENEPILINELNDMFMKKALNIVRQNMSNPEFGKDEFASTMNVSSSLLYKKMKSLTSQSPIDFIKAIRLNYALELLQSRKYTVTEIGEMCGFSSIGYFSTAFKRYFHKSPTEVEEELAAD